MRISSSNSSVTGYRAGLSTRARLFSTRHPQALHVRDVDFVRLFHKCTYNGTGADSRVVLASAPAFPKHAGFARVQSDLESLALVRSPSLLSPHTRHASHSSLSCSSYCITV